MELTILTLAAIAAAAIAARLCYVWFWTHTTVFDFQTGLLFTDGRFTRLLEAGRHRRRLRRTSVRIIDRRPLLVTVPGQDVLTRDKINVRISLALRYGVADPLKVETASVNHQSELYTRAQLILRARIADLALDEVLEARSAFDAALAADVAPEAEALGLELHSIAIRDIMLPGNLKRAYSGILEARKEAERLLETARGEQAVLRSLANSSKSYAANPGLLQARIIQALAAGGNSIVFSADPTQPVTVKPKGKG